METKIAFPAMVKHYRLAHNLTMEQLAEHIGKTKSTISKWESGVRSPKIYEIEEIAKFFGVEPSVMMFGKPSTKKIKTTPTLKAITSTSSKLKEPRQKIVLAHAKEQLWEQEQETPQPATVSEDVINIDDFRPRGRFKLNGLLSAGSGAWQEEDLGVTIFLYEHQVPSNYDSIAQVVGDSMEDEYFDGDYVFIKLTPTANYGDDVAVRIDDDNYLKRYKRDHNGRPYFQSLNPKHPNIYPTDDNDIRIIGRVVDVYHEG